VEKVVSLFIIVVRLSCP